MALVCKRKASPLPEIKETQLTTSSSDLAVGGNAISPDGKYLAYSDGRGIHVKLLATGEIRTLSEGSSQDYFAWFLIAPAFSPAERMWKGSGRIPSREAANTVSQGRYAQFRLPRWVSRLLHRQQGQAGDREIWLIGSDGKNPRIFPSVGEDATLQEPYWTRDGRRISYQYLRQTAKNLDSRSKPATYKAAHV